MVQCNMREIPTKHQLVSIGLNSPEVTPTTKYELRQTTHDVLHHCDVYVGVGVIDFFVYGKCLRIKRDIVSGDKSS